MSRKHQFFCSRVSRKKMLTEGGFSNQVISRSMQVDVPQQLLIPRLTIPVNSVSGGVKKRKSPPRGNLKGKFIELKKINKMDDLIELQKSQRNDRERKKLIEKVRVSVSRLKNGLDVDIETGQPPLKIKMKKLILS